MCKINVKDANREQLLALLKANGATIIPVTDETITPVTGEVQRQQTFAEIIEEYGMTKEQVEFYKQYSMERSRRAYERVAVKELGDDKLIDDWVYMGYWDAGFRGAEYCSAGHPLRYVHVARNKKTGKEIQFGIKCVTDFFNLTPAQIKFIKNGFNEANKEIQESIDRFVEFSGDWNAYEEKHHFKEKLDYILQYQPSALSLDTDKLVHMFKLAQIQHIFDLKLFLPKIWEHSIRSAYRIVFAKQKNNSPADEKLQYIKQHHGNIFYIIDSISSRTKLTDKQKYFLNKLLNTPWQSIDELIQSVDNKTANVTNVYIYQNLISDYNNYGLTEKQIQLLHKIVVKQ